MLPRISKDDSYFVYQFLVDKNFRSQNIGSVHLKKNNVFIKKAKKTAFLLCKKNLINFYLRNDWDLRIEKFIFIKNYKKKKNLMSLNLDKLTKTSKIIIDLKRLSEPEN